MLGKAGAPAQDGHLLAQEATSHGDQLPHSFQMAVHYVPQPPLRVMQGDKEAIPQLPGLHAWAWAVGLHGKMWVNQRMEACALHNGGHSLWGSSQGIAEGPW